MSPFKGLLQSRKFWLLILAFVVDLATLVVGQLAGLDQEFILKLIGIFSGMAAVIIGSIAWEDAAEKGNQPPAG